MHKAHVQEPESAARIAARVRRSLELGEGVTEAGGARQLLPAWGFVALLLACVCAMVVSNSNGRL
jgi:hypothetical protein